MKNSQKHDRIMRRQAKSNETERERDTHGDISCRLQLNAANDGHTPRWLRARGHRVDGGAKNLKTS